MQTAFMSGFLLGFSLILAIGAQNAFVLRQGLRRSHVFAVCLTCAMSDALLIVAGVAGFAALVDSAPWVQPVFRWGGAAFLFYYGAVSLVAAARGGHMLAAEGTSGPSRRATVLTVLALTWLNPHVYLDTLVLIGSVSTEFGAARWEFAGGAVAASFTFFFLLGYGARLLAPLFARPAAWRVLDLVVGATMWAIGWTLVAG